MLCKSAAGGLAIKMRKVFSRLIHGFYNKIKGKVKKAQMCVEKAMMG